MATLVGTDHLAALGDYAMRFVRAGQTLGLGSGRAASAFIRALGKSAVKVRGVPTSEASEALAREFNIEIIGLDQVAQIDTTFDGADEVDPRLNLIKGYGGALVREKVVAAASRRRVILVGSEKIVKRLGERGIVPVEVVPFAVAFCVRRTRALGLTPKIRLRPDGSRLLSDNGNLILDCGVNSISNPARLERELLSIPGIVGTGLFVAMADTVLVSDPGGHVRVLNRVRSQ